MGRKGNDMQLVAEYPKMSLYMQDGVPMARVRLKGGERHSKSFAGMDIEEAKKAAMEWYSTQPWAKGIMTGDSVRSVFSAYLKSIEAQGFPDNTVYTYESCSRCYVEPTIGDMCIGEVKPYTIESLYNVLLVRGASDGESLSPNTVCKLHGFLKGAFNWAKRMEIIESSPMDNVTKPRSVVSEAAAYTEDEMAALCVELENVMDSDDDSVTEIERIAAFAAYISLSTGMRCGEVCALKMCDVMSSADPVSGDERKYIHIAHTAVRSKKKGVVRQGHTKTNMTRNVSISSEVSDRIGDHLKWNIDRLGIAAKDMPLCTLNGKFIAPSRISHAFTSIRKDLNLPDDTSFHTLRHTHATWLLMNGIDIKTIQERLGHSKIETTLSIYSHVLPGRDMYAAAAFDSALKGGE